MKNEHKVLACVDQSPFSDHVADYAAWAARRMNAPLEFLHVIDRHCEQASGEDHSGAIGMDAEEHLLAKLVNEEGARTKLAREQGRVFLNRLRERALRSGVAQVDVRQRYGELEETLAEQAEGVRLLVLGRRGESAQKTHRDLGRNLERIVRAIHKPILTVTEAFKEPQRMMLAFDGSKVTRHGVESIAESPLFRGLPISLLMSGKETKDAAQQLDWAKKTLETAGFHVSASLIPGDAQTIIAKTALETAVDILIMGAFNHSYLHGMFFGSKTIDILRSSPTPTLLLR